MCQKLSSETILLKIQKLIELFQLSKTNVDGYIKLREYYNNGNNTPEVLYTLVCYSFNNQIRFNKKGKFNLPFGSRSFNPILKQKFIEFVDHIKTINIRFINEDFTSLDINSLQKDDFVYVDPPYSKTTSTYNENGGWTYNNDMELFKLLDNLNKMDIKFAMSNMLNTDWIKEWSIRYNVSYLEYNYKNCNYQKKDKSGKECEILITNYKNK
jgi:DNA adenine methylase Dam